MPITEAALYDALSATFTDAEIVLEDLAGDDDHWKASITSAAFVGKSRVAREKMVMEAVKMHDIHALSIKTTPKES